MKKFCLFAIVCFINLTNWAGNILDFSTGQICDNLSTKPLCNKVDYGDSIIITYDFQAAQIVNDDIFPGCIHWKYDGWGINHTQGEASFPVKYDTYTTTQNQDISISLIESEYIDFNYELAPARPLLVDNRTSSYSSENIAPIQPYSGFAPNEIIKIEDEQTQRNTSFHRIRISPIQYDHTNKIVRAFTKIKYKVVLPSTTKSRIGDIVIKPYPVEQDTISRDYIIISTNKYASAVYRFAKWKRNLGFKVKTALDDSWTSEKIKNKIQSLYNYSNECYALIIGDHQDVPSNTSSLRPTEDVNSFHFTDLYYGCFNGSDDYFSDIYLGRLPVSTLEEANTVIDKIINYEQNPTQNASFYNSGVICSEFDDANSNSIEDVPFIETSESIRNRLISLGKSVDRIYSLYSNVYPTKYCNGNALPSDLLYPSFAWNGSSSNIINSINAGRTFVLHYGHGDWSKWVGPSFSTTDILSLNNGNLLPVIFSFNCETGMYNISNQDCFAEAFLKKSGGGCVGIYAATNKSYIYPNGVIVENMFNSIWPQSDSSLSEPRLGKLLNSSLLNMAINYNASVNIRRFQSEIYHCFGDPSMMIRTETPTNISNISVNRNAEINGAVRVSIAGTGNTNDHYIAFHDNRFGNTLLVKGSSALYRTNYPEYVTVCVYNHNKIPYVNLGLEEELIQPLSVSEPTDFISNFGPNPTNGQITFEYSISENASSASILISDLYGNVKSNMTCSSQDNAITMDLSELSNGIYVATLIIDNVTKDTKRIIVQK